MRNKTLAFAVFWVLAFPTTATPVAAQEAQPGDPCAGRTPGEFRRAGGPEIPGTGHFMVCDGANWISILDYADTGQTLFQVNNDTGPCMAAKDGRIRYISAASPPWEYCDGGATAWLPFKQPRCVDDATGECYLDATRSNDDAQFVAANIASGVNILGVTGTLGGCTGSPTLVAHGAETAAATSFNLDPQALSASDGDTMVVVAVWEDDTSSISSPAGWTTLVDDTPWSEGSNSRVVVDVITFSGSVSSSETWTLTGSSGVAYGYSILSNLCSLGGVSIYLDPAGSTSPGVLTSPVAAGSDGLVAFALSDAESEAGEAGSFDTGITQETSDATPVAGRSAFVGYSNSSGVYTLGLTTTAIPRRNVFGIYLPLGSVHP